jgi:hypothetical protein
MAGPLHRLEHEPLGGYRMAATVLRSGSVMRNRVSATIKNSANAL